MSACQDYEELLTLHATGALEPTDEARVRAHLEHCAECRREAASTASLLGEVAMPALSAQEEEKLDTLPRRVAGAWRKAQIRSASRTRAAGALMATAAVLMLMMAPSILRHESPSTGAPPRAEVGLEASENEAEFEQWAAADPLLGMIDPAEALESDEGWDEGWDEDWEEAELEPTESETFLNLNPEE